MIHCKEELKDYVLLMLGSPVIVVDLSEEELHWCAEAPVVMVQQLTGIVNHQVLTRLVQEGAYALGRYIVAKKRFFRMQGSFLVTPNGDGFADMTQADSDWNEFVNEVQHYRRALRKNDEREAVATAQTD